MSGTSEDSYKRVKERSYTFSSHWQSACIPTNPMRDASHSRYKRVTGRSHTAEERTSMTSALGPEAMMGHVYRALIVAVLVLVVQ